MKIVGGIELKYIADMHTHTTFSVDGKDDITTMCRYAIVKGISCICFTEHFDLNPQDYGFGFFKLNEFSKAITEVQHEFGAKLEILKGVEFGEPHLYPKEFAQIVAQDFDMILAGLHCIGPDFVGNSELIAKYTLAQIFEMYYEVVLKAVQFGGFDVLAHLDLPKRYYKTATDLPEILETILVTMVKNNITLEINTSPLRKGFMESAPDVINLQRYITVGGSQVTFGSDAHSGPDIAADFDYATQLLNRANGAQVGLFRKRKFIPLDESNDANNKL